MADKALSGTKILEYAQFVAGPYCAKLMADLGAEVIKIEPSGGDIARKRGPFPNDIPHPEKSGLFLYLNTNKLGITLNLNSTKGQDIFRKLIKETDIFIEDTPPGTMQNLGLDYEVLSQLNPQLIMTSITPFGQTGPHKDYKAYYLNISHASGLGYITPQDFSVPNLREREPTKEGTLYVGYDCGLFAAVATLVALYGRRIIGKGQYIDVSKQEVLMHTMRPEMAAYFIDRHSTYRSDPLSMGTPNTYPCKDGYILLGYAEDRMWQGLMELMGNPEWAKDERFNFDNRNKHADESYPRIAEWTKQYTREEVFHKTQEHLCSSGPALRIGEVPNLPHLKEREFFVEIDHPEAGKLSYASGSAKFSKTPLVFERPAPLLGEHNEEIYCHRLGFNQEELPKLRAADII